MVASPSSLGMVLINPWSLAVVVDGIPFKSMLSLLAQNPLKDDLM